MKRAILTGVCLFLLGTSCWAGGRAEIEEALRRYVAERADRARIGVAVVTDRGRMFGVRTDEAFPMMSVVKFPLALTVVRAVEERGGTLNDSIPVAREQLHTDTYSPMLGRYSSEADHRIAIRELLDYALRSSDNNACDILMEYVGGASVVDRYVKEAGIGGVEVKWDENDMHVDVMRCYENASTPAAMARLADRFDRCFDDPRSRVVKRIMERCETGTDRLAKPFEGIPSVVVGHKTGTGPVDPNTGRIMAINDVGYVHLPDGRRYVIAVFVAESAYSPEETAALIADISELVWKGLTGAGEGKKLRRAMREEADAFLRAMPQGLQADQARAVTRAIEGDDTALRAVRAARNQPPTLSANVAVRELSATLRLYEPVGTEEGRPLPLLIYLHGGGWTFGSINSCGRFCDAMAATGRVKVLAVDYRLAPEHPYPCGYRDCVEAVKYALARAAELGIDPGRIVVGGDSAGGNLAVATALDPECVGKIEALVLFYPVTRAFADGSASWERYGEGYALDTALMNRFNRAYAPRIPSGDSRIDVGLASAEELAVLPRTLLVAAGRDILRDQGLEFARRLPAGKARRVEFPGAVHLFITVPGQETAFRRSVTLATDFIDRRRGR